MSSRYPIDGSRDALWMSTAVPAPETESLNEALDVDVVIVGGGLTGLNAALDLVSGGTSVAVLEARTLGFGASGRSGGQVNLGLNLPPAELRQKFGSAAAEPLIRLLRRVPDIVFRRIRDHQLDCDPVQNGWIQAATTVRQWSDLQKLASDFADPDDAQYGQPFLPLDGDALAERTGSHRYRAGLFCPTSGSLHPLSYTRELARKAIEGGARLFTNSPVIEFEPQRGGWLVRTETGQVTCGTVLLCTNAYTDQLDAALAKTLVPVRSIQIASEPLSHNLRHSVLPDQVTFVDKRRLILYMRYDRDGRLCVGDHGPARDEFRRQDFDAVKRRALEVFPQLKGVRWDFHWGGRVGITADGLPFLHRVAPGMIAGMGYNGRGVGMGTIMGMQLAQAAVGVADKDLDFPVTEPETFAFHRFSNVGTHVAVKWFALRDYLESLRN